MGEDLRTKAEAQEKVNHLQVIIHADMIFVVSLLIAEQNMEDVNTYFYHFFNAISGSTQTFSFGTMQVELSSTLEVKAQLEEQLSKIAEETFFLEKKADDYSRELQELLSKVGG